MVKWRGSRSRGSPSGASVSSGLPFNVGPRATVRSSAPTCALGNAPMVAYRCHLLRKVMDSTSDLSNEFHDPRDQFRNGFVAAVTYLRGQRHPTDEQIHAATNELCLYRLTGTADDRPSVQSPCGSVESEPDASQYEHSDTGPNSSRWARREHQS